VHPNEPIRVLLLAPMSGVGGISSWGKALLKYSDGKCVKFKVIDTTKLYDPLGKKLNLRGVILGIRDALTRMFAILKNIREFKPQMVYFTCSPSIGIVRDSFYILFLRLLNISTLAHLHGGNIKGFFGQTFILRSIVQIALTTCCAILVVTREVEKVGHKLFGPAKVIYIPNMIDDEILSHSYDKHISCSGNDKLIKLLHVAWQAPEKGSLDLVEAMQYIKHPVRCDLVGIAATMNHKLIEKRINDLGVSDRIRLVGQKISDEKKEFFIHADIFVFPSHCEGFPMVILEAMAYGLPIIASDVGNIREMIGADSASPAGLLLKRVNPIDHKELGEVIGQLIANNNLRAKFSIAGKMNVRENYLASKVVRELEAMLIDLIYVQKSNIVRN
jgi:glycosyltransferase involved in cell wall biosynthesis